MCKGSLLLGVLNTLGRIGFIDVNLATPYCTPHPIQQLDERFVTQALRRLCKLAYAEVRLLLTSTLLTEGYAPNLYHRRAQARIIRPTAHLALLLLVVSCLDQEVLPSVRGCCPLLGFNNYTKSLQGRREQRILQKEDIPRPLVG